MAASEAVSRFSAVISCPCRLALLEANSLGESDYHVTNKLSIEVKKISGSAKKTCIAYLVFIHVLLAVVIVKSDFVQRVSARFGFATQELPGHYQAMADFQDRVDQNVLAQSVLFIGDSHIQGLAVSAVSARAVNFGIGGDTTVGVMKRLRNYRSLKSAKAVVLAVGFNDLRFRSNDKIVENLREILAFFDERVKVVLCAVIPVGEKEHEAFNERISNLNAALENSAKRHGNVIYLDSFTELLTAQGYLPATYHLPDAIHLSERGYAHWISRLTNSLKSAGN